MLPSSTRWLLALLPATLLHPAPPAAAALRDPIAETQPTTRPAAPDAARPAGLPPIPLPPPFQRYVPPLPEPATQPAVPATLPAAADDPQRSPRAAVATFLRTLNESKTRPARIIDAVACLDVSGLPAADRAELGPLRAQQLGEIIDVLFRRDGRSTEDLPDEPTGLPAVVHTEGELAITLSQQQDGRWRFTTETVAAIPQLRQALMRAATTQPVEPAAPPDVPVAYRSARATMATYLAAHEAGDMAAAARCLDLGGLPAPARDSAGRRLASRLREVIVRVKRVVPQDIPDRPDGGPYTFYLDERGRIEIARQEDGERRGHWLFSRDTVASIEALFAAHEGLRPIDAPGERRFIDDPSLWVRDKIPPALKERQFGLERWQWLGLLLIALVGMVVQRAATAAIRVLSAWRLARHRIKLSRLTMVKFVRPFGILAMALTWYGGVQLLDLGARPSAALLTILKFVAVIAAIWAAYRLIDLLGVYLHALAERTVTKVDDVLVPLLRKTIKIVLIVVGVMIVLQTIGVQEASLNTVFAGLGLGGLAFALAAQDTLKNFFGSVTVVVDRPFQVGDWIRIGDVEGAVQSVGLRSTRLRTMLDSEVTIPNANLINANVDNLGRRLFRLYRTTIALTYDTPVEKLEAFCEGVRELIRRHPYTRKDMYHVYVNDLAESSINVLMVAYYRTPDWATELRERHRLLLDVIRLAERLGISFAFPSRTLHLTRAAAPPATAPPSRPTSAPPTPYPALDPSGRPAEPLILGRNEAAAIVAQTLPPTADKPPPVAFDGTDKPTLSPSETRFL